MYSKKYSISWPDNNNSYYDLNLKIDRNKSLNSLGNFDFYETDLNDNKKISEIIKNYRLLKIVHLAAQAGVRYSVDNPHAYIDSNINGFFNIINCAKNNNIEHFIYASSSLFTEIPQNSLKKIILLISLCQCMRQQKQ